MINKDKFNSEELPNPEQSRSQGKPPWDPNAPETEEDAIRAESLRRLKIRQMFKGRSQSEK
jgi:hypothetical protein